MASGHQITITPIDQHVEVTLGGEKLASSDRALLLRETGSPDRYYLPADDVRRNMPRFQGENFRKNLELVKKIEELAAAKGCTPSQLALAWVLAQGKDVVPIPGTKRREYMEQNAAAAGIALSAAEIAQLAKAFPLGAASGTRYPEKQLGGLGI